MICIFWLSTLNKLLIVIEIIIMMKIIKIIVVLITFTMENLLKSMDGNILYLKWINFHEN